LQGEAKEILSTAGLKPIVLGAKEGLAMINGTQLIASLGAEAVEVHVHMCCAMFILIV
jgi:histidine ammonia-lyase